MYSLFIGGIIVNTFEDPHDAREAFVEATLMSNYRAIFVMDPAGHVICTNHN